MKRIRFGFLVLAGVHALVSALTAAPELTRLVPASSPLVLHVRSFSELRQGWAGSSYAKAWLDPEIRTFLAPTVATMTDGEGSLLASLKKDTGLEPDEFFALFSGEAIFALRDAAPYFRDEEDENPQILLAIECGASTARIREVIAHVDESADTDEEELKEEFQGETIHVTLRKVDDDSDTRVEREAWAIVDDILLVGEPKSVVQEAIVALKRGGVADSIADHPALAALYRKSPDTHAVVHIGLDGIINPLVDMIESTAGQTDAEGNPSGPAATLAQIGLTPRGLFHTLGLDALRSLDISLAFRERETVVEGDLAWTEKRGLLRMAAMGEPPVALPDFIPDTWVFAGVDNFSLREMVGALLSTIAEVSPLVDGIVRQQLMQANTQLGIDVERDIFGSFGDVMISGYAVPAGQPAAGQPLDQFLAISLSNPDAFRGAIDALLGRLPFGQMMESREYLGETIRSMTPPNGKPFAFAITRGHLLVSIGGPAMVESAIQGLQGGAAKSFWKKPEVARALKALPDGYSSFVVADLGRMMGLVADFLAENSAKTGDAGGDAGGDEDEEGSGAPKMPILVDPSARPSAETIAKYWTMMSRGLYSSPNGFHVIIKTDNGR